MSRAAPEDRAPRPCPHCGDDALGALTPERLAALAAELAGPACLGPGDALYRRRLERCGCCAALREGVLCAYCGCFVRFRAGVPDGYCPSPGGDKWAV
jgi:hypothetical protein